MRRFGGDRLVAQFVILGNNRFGAHCLKPRRMTSLKGPPSKDSTADATPRLFPSPLLMILCAAFAMVLPFFFLGNPSGHDFEFHLNSWMEIVRQWQHGILYPRWAPFAHYLYGEARFLFYPPLSWNVGALLGVLFPWKMVPGAYVFLAALLSGCSMFLLARSWLDRGSALFAAMFYALNPYAIVVVYWRSAFAELLAGTLLPLLLLWAMRAPDRSRAVVVPLSLIVAAAWLTNVPAAVMISYSLALMMVVVAIARRSPRVLLHAAGAVTLGIALAAFYILPVAYEMKWVNLAEVLAPGVRPQDNFLFTLISDADHNRFNFLVSIMAVAEIAGLAGTVSLAGSFRKRMGWQWWLLATWGTASVLLMLPMTRWSWEHLPQLRFVQLPWRWLCCLNVVLAILLAAAFRRWVPRMLLWLAMLVVVWLVWHRVQPPWWDQAADIAEMHENFHDNVGYEGTDEYVPAGADPYEIDQKAPYVALDGSGGAGIQVQQWDAESKVFTTHLDQPGRAVLRLFNYPAWQVRVNGQLVSAGTREVTGQMVISLPEGDDRVQVTFVRTRDRVVGGMISLVALVGIGALLIFRKEFRFLGSEY